MKTSFKTGFSFGLTSAVITTLGLIVGLDAGTHSKLAVVGGILTIAVADAFSDALGIHISEESKDGNSQSEIWESTISTFLAKFIFALTFVAPVLLFNSSLAVLVDVVWGFLLLAVVSFLVAKEQGRNSQKAIMEHLAIAFLVVVSRGVGYGVARLLS
ncbi:hypothetical protein KKD61_04320 [Patescibacteria group bacterium]|nr:hypothetical protein [Patescibacteria group bacterium]